MDELQTPRISAVLTRAEPALAIRPHLDSFEPHTMDPVVTIGG